MDKSAYSDTWRAKSKRYEGSGPFTRRGILSIFSSIFDPLGILSHVVLSAEKILQNLCRIELGWNNAVPTTVAQEWTSWLEELKFSQIQFHPSYGATAASRCTCSFTSLFFFTDRTSKRQKCWSKEKNTKMHSLVCKEEKVGKGNALYSGSILRELGDDFLGQLYEKN